MKAFVDSVRAHRAGYIERRNVNRTANPSDQGNRNIPPRQRQQRQSQLDQATFNMPPAAES